MSSLLAFSCVSTSPKHEEAEAEEGCFFASNQGGACRQEIQKMWKALRKPKFYQLQRRWPTSLGSGGALTYELAVALLRFSLGQAYISQSKICFSRHCQSALSNQFVKHKREVLSQHRWRINRVGFLATVLSPWHVALSSPAPPSLHHLPFDQSPTLAKSRTP